MDVLDRIRQQVESTPILIYMKGSPQFPMCGFSSRTVQAMQACEAEFGYINVLEDPEIFENLHRFADWPTFPQVYVAGELIGGCDITLALYERGELQPMLQEAAKNAGQAAAGG